MNYRKIIAIMVFEFGVLLFTFTILPVEVVLARMGEATSSGSCLAPTNPEQLASCQLLEKEMLQSTVRFQIEYWLVKPDESGYLLQNSIGHGTVKDGRYLVTHNHFSEPFTNISGVDQQAIYRQFRIYNAAGELLTEMSGKNVSIAVQDEQTLILDFGEQNGFGFFADLGLASADFKDWHLLPIELGSEVAQIDWDGSKAWVDWTTILEVQHDQDVFYLVLSDKLKIGASGGGVFFQGVHIGNNWQTAPAGQISTAALNSSWVKE